ncbi:MAG: hypothetical protein QM770_06505 [Tepidisphaeraceae bacterium]
MRGLACVLVLVVSGLMLPSAPAAPITRPGGDITPPARREVPGQRFDLTCGKLFVPDYIAPAEQVNVVIWFHGAAWCVEQEMSLARTPAVLLTWDANKRKPQFADEASIEAVLTEVVGTLCEHGILTGAKGGVRRVGVGSFSGGYGAVLDLLRLERFSRQVSDVVLADSLYPPRGKTNFVDLDEPLAPVLAYARRAAAGECRLVFSQLYPPDPQYRGNGTTIAANWLIDRTGATRTKCDDTLDGRRRLYHADRAGLHVIGLAGMANQDHFDHLYQCHVLLREMTFE